MGGPGSGRKKGSGKKQIIKKTNYKQQVNYKGKTKAGQKVSFNPNKGISI